VLLVQNVEVIKFLFNEARITDRAVRIEGECELGALIEVGIFRARSNGRDKWEREKRAERKQARQAYAKTLFYPLNSSMILSHRHLHHYPTTPHL
jgi:hypothetical protein